MGHQISEKAHKEFLKNIERLRSIYPNDSHIVEAWGVDTGNFSNFANGKKWPGRKTLKKFNDIFIDVLKEFERSLPENNVEQSYNDAIPLLKKHGEQLTRMEEQLSAIHTTLKALLEKSSR